MRLGIWARHLLCASGLVLASCGGDGAQDSRISTDPALIEIKQISVSSSGSAGMAVSGLTTPYSVGGSKTAVVSTETATMVFGSNAQGETISLTLQLPSDATLTVSSRETALAILWLAIGGYQQYIFPSTVDAKIALAQEPEFESLVAALENATQAGTVPFTAPVVRDYVSTIAQRRLTSYADAQHAMVAKSLPPHYFYGSGFFGDFVKLEADENGAVIRNLFKTYWAGSVKPRGGDPVRFQVAAKELNAKIWELAKAAESPVPLGFNGPVTVAVFQDEISRQNNIVKVLKSAMTTSLGHVFKGTALDNAMSCTLGVNGTMNTTVERLSALANGQEFVEQLREAVSSALSPATLTTIAACAKVDLVDAAPRFAGEWAKKYVLFFEQFDFGVFVIDSFTSIWDIKKYYSARQEKTFCARGGTLIGEGCDTAGSFEFSSTVTSAQVGAPISTTITCGSPTGLCEATMYCTPPSGQGEHTVETLPVALNAALGTGTIGSGAEFKGSYSFETGAVTMSNVEPLTDVTPIDSRIRYFSAHRTDLTGEYNPVTGVFTGTSVETVVNTWSADSRQVVCRSTASVAAKLLN